MATKVKHKLDHQPLIDAMQRYIVRPLTEEEREGLKLAATDFIAANERAILDGYGGKVMADLRERHSVVLERLAGDLHLKGADHLSAGERVDVIRGVIAEVMYEWQRREWDSEPKRSITEQLEQAFSFKGWTGVPWIPVVGMVINAIFVGCLLAAIPLVIAYLMGVGSLG